MNKTPLPPPKTSNPQIQSYVEAIQRGQQSQHVIPRAGGWVVKRAGASHASRTFRTQAEAIDYGKMLAEDSHVDLVIHEPNGRVRSQQ